MTNPQMPGRKLHNVESFRGHESHRTSGAVRFNPKGREVIAQMDTYSDSFVVFRFSGLKDMKISGDVLNIRSFAPLRCLHLLRAIRV